MDIANPNGRISADGMFFSGRDVIGVIPFYGKKYGDTDDGKTEHSERTGNRDCNRNAAGTGDTDGKNYGGR